MQTNIQTLSRLMKLSWDIQHRKRLPRAKALQAAWAIVSNDDITISYLAHKLNHHKPVNRATINQFSLFKN